MCCHNQFCITNIAEHYICQVLESVNTLETAFTIHTIPLIVYCAWTGCIGGITWSRCLSFSDIYSLTQMHSEPRYWNLNQLIKDKVVVLLATTNVIWSMQSTLFLVVFFVFFTQTFYIWFSTVAVFPCCSSLLK